MNVRCTIPEPEKGRNRRWLRVGNRCEWDAHDDEAWLSAMAWAEPRYSRQEVNAAAKRMLQLLSAHYVQGKPVAWNEADSAEYFKSADVIDNWRACHGYPLNILQLNLRRLAKKFDQHPLIAQRTKRLVSIAIKLDLQPKMKLTQMQDIGGCRAVLKSVAAVRELDAFYRKKSGMRHELVHYDDYITFPRDSGYRSVHFVYRYLSHRKVGSRYNGLKIEIQLRSQYQHAWATAVETVGTFIGQALKSSFGANDWLRFFALMGSAIAIREKTPAVPGVPTNRRELIDELDNWAYKLNVENRLRGYAEALRTIERATAQDHFYLLKLDPGVSQLTVTGFKIEDSEKAQLAYSEAEKATKEKPGMDAVLVSVDSLAALPRAYPNYFADTRIFVELLRQALSGHQRRIFTGALKLDPGPPAPSSAGQSS